MSGFDNGGYEPPNFNQPPMAPPPPTVQMPTVAQSSGRGDQSKNKGWILAISVMAALVLLGGGVLLGIAFLGDDGSNSASDLSGSHNSGDSSNGSAGVATDATESTRVPATTDSTAPLTSATTTSSTTTSTAPAPTAAPAPASTYDWDGVRFEYGSIEAVERIGTDVVISFDRYSLYVDGDYRDATYFTSEQIVVANTDAPGKNSNPKLRRYAVMPDVNLITVVGLDGSAACDGGAPAGWTPTWAPFTMDQLIAMDAATVRGNQTSLTFDAAGRVTQIRHSDGC